MDVNFLKESLPKAVIQAKNSTLTSRNLTALSGAEASVVITGQQTGLFLGPTFNLYKIISTIKHAKQIEAETKKPCVPVFWLQDEDHDIKEINFANLSDTHGVTRKIALETDERKISVKNRLLGDDIKQSLSELGDNSLNQILSRHYTPENSWSDAFGGALSELFSEYGLIVFDPRNINVAKHVSHLYVKALKEWREVTKCLVKDSASVTNAVHVREDSPLFFLHKDSADGERFRLKEQNEIFSLIGDGTKFSEKEILEIINNDPLRVSSSALFRPIIQNYLFRVKTYIGGNAEVNYWKQLPTLHNHFKIPMPKVVARISARLIEPKIASGLKELNLSAAEIETDTSKILEKLLPCDSEITPLREELLASVSRAFKIYSEKSKIQGSSFDAKLDQTLANVKYIIEKFSASHKKLIVESNKSVADKLARLQRSIFPNGELQERFFALCSFTAKHEIFSLIDKVIKASDHNKQTTQDIYL